MPEFLLDNDFDRVEYVRPDEDGFTVRTRYRDTEETLDRNRAMRNAAPRSFKQDGTVFHHVASFPPEVYEMIRRRLGRDPTAAELIRFANEREFSQMKTREVKL